MSCIHMIERDREKERERERRRDVMCVMYTYDTWMEKVLCLLKNKNTKIVKNIHCVNIES